MEDLIIREKSVFGRNLMPPVNTVVLLIKALINKSPDINKRFDTIIKI